MQVLKRSNPMSAAVPPEVPEHGTQQPGEDSLAAEVDVYLKATKATLTAAERKETNARVARIAEELKGMTREELFADIDRSAELAKRHHEEVRAHVKFVDHLCSRLERLASDMKHTQLARKQLLARIERIRVRPCPY